MAQTKREQYESNRRHVRELADKGEIEQVEADAILEWCDAYDPEKVTVTPNDADHESNRWGDSRSPATLRQWIVSVTAYARDFDGSLLEATTYDINQISQRMYDGEAVSVTKPLSKNTVRSRQNCIKKFLRHSDATAEAEGITVFDKQSTVIDPEDMLTRDEFHALRNAPEHPRDQCLVDLFLYTGQRNNALRTLRVKDLRLDEGKYRLNSDADGLKGADLIGTWNPLLGAVGSIRDWKQHHPNWDNPDAYLLTERRDSVVRDATTTVSDDTVNRILREAAEKAALEEPGIKNKPTHAHAMRHNFVTMCKRDYNLDDDVIKRLIRHKPESDVMNTTYAHLSDSDYIKKAEEAFGLREEEDESPMTPDHCTVCREPLPPQAKACHNCGAVFTPDAKGAQDQLSDTVKESYKQTDPDDDETMEELEAIEQALDDPEVKQLLLEKLADE